VGAWLFRDPHGHQLRNGDVHTVPSKMLFSNDLHHPYLIKIIFHAAVLSSSPDSETCVAISIVRATVPLHYRYIAIWQKG
jgi:hypothetical protein